MKNVTSSFWFWLLIIGIFLILFAALIAGGMKETNNWVWGLFVVGAVFAVLGIIFAIVEWSCLDTSQYVNCPELNKDECPYANITSSPYSNVTSNVTSPGSLSFEKSVSYSPIGTPTKVNMNVPQAQRGFATTDKTISSLAP